MDSTIVLTLASLASGLAAVISAVVSLVASLRAKAKVQKEIELHADELLAKFIDLEKAVAGSPLQERDEGFSQAYRQLLLESIARLDAGERNKILQSVSRLSDPEQVAYVSDLLSSSRLAQVQAR